MTILLARSVAPDMALAISFVYLKMPKIKAQTPAQPDTLVITSK